MQNSTIRILTRVTKNVTEILKENRLKWFGHICSKNNTSMVYKACKNIFLKPRPTGRSAKR